MCSSASSNHVFPNNLVVNTAHSFSSLDLLHARLGHVSFSSMKHIPHVKINTNKENFHCESCILGKHHKFPFPVSCSHASTPFALIHIDLWGPYRSPSLSGATYFLTILDDYSRTTWTHLLHSKHQVFHIISNFLSYVCNQFNTTVKIIRSDNGTEIFNQSCSSLFASKGIIHQRSLPGLPQQNGRVERKHRHLLDIARTLRFHAGLPIKFWGDCLLTATYLINLMPTPVLNWKSPYELLMNKPINFDHLRVFGSLCYPAHKTNDKFAPRAKRCMFLGYPYDQKGYKLYDLDTHKILLSRDVIFKENIFPYKQHNSLKIYSQQNEPIFSSSDISEDNSIFQQIPSINPSSSPSFTPQSINPSFTSESDQQNTFIPSPASSPLLPNPRRSSRIPSLPSKYKDFVTNIPNIKPLTTPRCFFSLFFIF